MALVIPDLYDAGLTFMSVCGLVTTSDKKLHAFASSHGDAWHHYYIRRPRKLVIVGVVFDDHSNYIHVHFNIAKKEWFSKRKVPKESKEAIPFDELLDIFKGQKAEVSFVADFRVRIDRLPPLVRSIHGFSATQDGVKVTMTGGILSVRGSPISKIEWSTDSEAKETALVTMSGSADLVISDSYLDDCFQRIVSYSETFIDTQGVDAEN